jgi:hypothetical protein
MSVLLPNILLLKRTSTFIFRMRFSAFLQDSQSLTNALVRIHDSHVAPSWQGTPEKLRKAPFALELGPRGFSSREDATSTIQTHNFCDSRQKLAPRTRTFAGMFSQVL